jgi:hypothetical protein
MPIVSCSSCKSRFKVRLEAVNTVMTCPKCDAEFRAVALHSTPRKAHGLPPVAYAGIVAGALLLALLIAKAVGGRDEEPAEDADARASAARTSAAADGAAAAKPAETRPSGAREPRDLIAERARDVLEAIRDGNETRLGMLLVDFSLMHEDRRAAGLEDRAWLELPAEEQFLKKDEYVALLLGEEEQRDFTRRAVVESVETTELRPGGGAVEAVLKDPLEDTRQKVTLRFAAFSGSWKLIGLDRAAADGAGRATGEPDADRATAEAAVKLAELRRTVGAEPAPVEPVPGTSAALTSTIEQHIGVLIDPEETTGASRARRELADIGKPAIPFLLNGLVGLDLADPEDVRTAAKLTEALRDVTGQDFVIMPGSNEASMTGEGNADNEQCRRRWFGWWRDSKNTFEERVDDPIEPAEPEPAEDD